MAYALHVCNQKICPSVVFDWYNLFESGPKCLFPGKAHALLTKSFNKLFQCL